MNTVMNESKQLTIFILSDGTGETADQMIKAALVQFVRENVRVIRYKNVRSESQVASIFEEAHQLRAVVVYTVVPEVLREYIRKTSKQMG
ncbi:MAG: kinase/pyrophosphorylase, partial [Deltaproteobacteria bacterium]|nr:kinase/pyrophosphorylase [Deltaproteobacteria bacterium]